MPKPTDPSQHAYMFSDDMKFAQKAILLHPEDPEKFLIIKRAMHIYSRPGDWDLPGGNVLFGEQHEESLRREILEETGITVGDLYPIRVFTNYEEAAKTYYLFINYKSVGLQKEVVLGDEHTEYRWVTLQEFLSLDPVSFLRETAEAAFK